jgi:hypothetical protein
VNSLVKLEKCVLDGVFGILLAAEHPAGCAEKRLFVTLIDHLVSGEVALTASLDNLVFLRLMHALIIYPFQPR